MQGKIQVRDIQNTLIPGDSPLDFIQKNLEGEKPPAIDVQKVADETKKEIDAAKKIEEERKALEPEIPLGDVKEEVKVEAAPEEASIEPEHKTPEDSLKDLRKALVQSKQELKAKEEAALKLAKQIEEYQTGAAVPDLIKTKEEEIERLSRYEKLHNLKMSKEYEEAFINPLNTLGSKLKEIAADYEVPEDVMTNALGLTSRRNLNHFLSSHFDEEGAREVKEVITKMQEIQTQALEAEKEPGKVLENLKEDQKRVMEVRNAARKNKIAATSKNSWVDSLLKIREEGLARELIMEEGNPEHNEKYVKPIITTASQEYGKLVSALANAGLEELPYDVAYALARMTQLAHASALSITTREAALKHAEEIETNTRRTNSMIRPQIGSNMGGGGGAPPKEVSHETPRDAAAELLKSVMG